MFVSEIVKERGLESLVGQVIAAIRDAGQMVSRTLAHAHRQPSAGETPFVLERLALVCGSEVAVPVYGSVILQISHWAFRRSADIDGVKANANPMRNMSFFMLIMVL